MHVAYRHHIVNRNIHVAHIHYRCAVMFAAACAIHEYMIRCYTQPLPGEAEEYARAAALLAVPKSMLRPGPILQRGAEGFDVEGPPREEVAAAARAHDEVEAIFNEAMVSCILRAWASCNIGKLRGYTAGRIRICWPYIYRLIIHLRRQLRWMSLMQLKVLMSPRRSSRHLSRCKYSAAPGGSLCPWGQCHLLFQLLGTIPHS